LSKSAFDLNYPILARDEKKVVPVQMIGYMRRCQQDEDERHCPPREAAMLSIIPIE